MAAKVTLDSNYCALHWRPLLDQMPGAMGTISHRRARALASRLRSIPRSTTSRLVAKRLSRVRGCRPIRFTTTTTISALIPIRTCASTCAATSRAATSDCCRYSTGAFSGKVDFRFSAENATTQRNLERVCAHDRVAKAERALVDMQSPGQPPGFCSLQRCVRRPAPTMEDLAMRRSGDELIEMLIGRCRV
jgi:hypothetical protein